MLPNASSSGQRDEWKCSALLLTLHFIESIHQQLYHDEGIHFTTKRMKKNVASSWQRNCATARSTLGPSRPSQSLHDLVATQAEIHA